MASETPTLPDLLIELEAELKRIGYTKQSIYNYKQLWKKLLQFAKEKGCDTYSEQLGLD